MNARLDPAPRDVSFRPVAERPRYSILCADDEPAILRLYLQALTRGGYEVDTFEDGVAAWEALQTRTYDLILTDYEMPRMKGLELARRVRASGDSPPIIIATAHVAPLLGENLSAIRFSAILLKPFSLVDLLVAVGRVLPVTRRGAGDDSVRPHLPPNQVFHLPSHQRRHWGLNE
jgi:CheY-like chemotaxis protein